MKCIVKRGCFFQPSANLRVFVRGVVVRDQMQIKVARCFAVDLLEEPEPFDMGVACLGAGDQFSGQLAERGEQRDRAVPDIVVRHGGRALRRQRKTQLRAFERLALALLVAARARAPWPAD